MYSCPLSDTQTASSGGSSFFSALANMFLPSGPANDARSARRGKPKNQLHTLQPSLHLTATSTNNLGSGGGGGRQTQRPPPAQLFSAYSGTASVQGGGPIRAAADPHRIGRRPKGGGGGLRLLPSFVGSLVATATPASVEPASTRHVSSGVSVAASRRRPPGNNNVEIITGKPGLLPPPATPRTFTLNLPFKKQIGRYPDPYLSTLPPPLSAASSALQQLPPKQPKPNPLKQQHSTTNPKPHSAADYYYDDDDEYYYDDSDQDQLSPPQILQIVNTVQSALEKPPERRTRLPFSSNPSNSFQIPRQPKQQSQRQQQAFLTSNSLNRFSGRQVAVKGFPNGLPDATPEGVVIALLNAQNSNITEHIIGAIYLPSAGRFMVYIYI